MSPEGRQADYRALLEETRFERPNVYILGAGASRAAFPVGDRNARRLPVMADLVETLGLDDELESVGVPWRDINFEELYGRLAADPASGEITRKIEERIRSYFGALQLPETATLYDRLVLSLRPKDVIATFNWDPFLMDACARNYWVADPPQTLFLHGSVRVGICSAHQKAGPLPGHCVQCREPLQPSRLLFPVTEKDYTDDPYIANQWQRLRTALKNAYVLTIFGYGAPQSDVEAVALMKDAWGNPYERNLEEIELIDVKPREELEQTWKPFIHTHHYRTYRSWDESSAAKYPRRSCEAMWNTLMEINSPVPTQFPLDADLDAVRDWIAPLVAAEQVNSE